MIEARPFVLYATCQVIYNGRATSRLASGNYLIIYKVDGSVAIHGSTMVMPRNYISTGSHISIVDNVVSFARKKEVITITIHDIISITYLNNWSNNKIEIYRTEKDLVRKIFNNWENYFDDDFETVECEFQTTLGPIDIIGRTIVCDYVVEVKRGVASLKDVTQLRRYLEALSSTNRQLKGYLAAPNISNKANAYLEKHGLNYLNVDFDETNDAIRT